MRNERVQIMVEIALCVALAAVLHLAARFTPPIAIAGGTISLSMVPIFVLALRRGLVVGIIGGAIFGCVDLLLEPFIVSPIQVLLDYPIAFGLTGLAGLGSVFWHANVERGKLAAGALATIPFLVLGAAGRYAAHWLSGVIFFGQNAPAGQPVWLYSLVYNASYVLPSLVISAVVTVAVLPVLERAIPSQSPRPGLG